MSIRTNLVVCLYIFSLILPAQADDSSITVVKLPAPTSIPGLELYSPQFSVAPPPPTEVAKRYALLLVTVTYFNPDYALFLDGKKQTPTPKGKFQLKLPINRAVNDVRFLAKDNAGAEIRTVFRVTLKNWEDIKKQYDLKIVTAVPKPAPSSAPSPTASPTPTADKPASTSLSVGVGVTLASYTETGQPNVSATMGMAKASLVQPLGFLINNNWLFGLSGYMTFFNLGSNLTGVSLQYIGANAKFGYKFSLTDSVTLSLFAGGYFATMSSTGANLGYSGLIGPEVYPALRYQWSDTSAVQAYVKLSMIGNGSSFSFNNSEIAGGLGYSYILGNGHPITLSIDLAVLNFEVQTIKAQSNTTSFSLGYTF